MNFKSKGITMKQEKDRNLSQTKMLVYKAGNSIRLYKITVSQTYKNTPL